MENQQDRNPRKALGKGLSALLPSRSSTASNPVPRPQPAQISPAQVATSLPERFDDFQSIPLEHIQPGEQQPRESFDGEKLEQLAQSIRVNGLIQPITVHKIGPDRFRIVAGERRWRAARLAGLTAIPAFVRTVEQFQALELALVENIQREDLNPIEIASAFERLSSQHGLSHEQIAERTGKQRSTVTNFLRLLNLGMIARNELIAGRISTGHARALLNITDPNQQARICDDIVNNRLSVRETEALVKKLTEPEAPPASSQAIENKVEPPQVDPNVRAAIDQMEMALGTKVRLIMRSEDSGRLEIEYYSQDDLERIYSVIVKQ